MSRLFGTDGVRGVAGRELTGELAYGLGRAAVAVLGRHGERRPSFVLGRDTRASGEFLEAARGSGLVKRAIERAGEHGMEVVPVEAPPVTGAVPRATR